MSLGHQHLIRNNASLLWRSVINKIKWSTATDTQWATSSTLYVPTKLLCLRIFLTSSVVRRPATKTENSCSPHCGLAISTHLANTADLFSTFIPVLFQAIQALFKTVHLWGYCATNCPLVKHDAHVLFLSCNHSHKVVFHLQMQNTLRHGILMPGPFVLVAKG